MRIATIEPAGLRPLLATRTWAVTVRKALLTILYCSTDRLRRGGAPVQNLPHSASFHSMENNAPSKSGIKHLVGHPGKNHCKVVGVLGIAPVQTDSLFGQR